MELRAGVASDRGLVRQTNEDSYLVRRGLYAVCDGMGGARAGEVASEMACRALLALDPVSAGPEELRGAIADADLAIARRSLEEERFLGMGTTLTAVLAGERSLSLAHVGDSRAYLLRDGTLTQLTDDHSWVGEMVRRGELTLAQAAVHPHRSVITRALGTDGGADPDILEVPVGPGDRVMLCSDGLTSMITDTEIADILRRDEDPQTVAGLLVQAALIGGGEDNVTVVVLYLGSADDGSGADQAQAGPVGADVLMGPDDRGVLSAARTGRGGRSGARVRGRLGGRVGPLLRPTAARSARSAPPPPTASAPSTAPESSVPVRTGAPAETTSAETTSVEATPSVESPAAAAPGEAPEAHANRWTHRKWIVVAIIVVVVLAIAVGGFALYNSTVYYVGAFDGTVALYRGLPGSILGISLSSVAELGNVAYDSLAPFLQDRVDAHDLLSKAEGQLFLRSVSAPQ